MKLNQNQTNICLAGSWGGSGIEQLLKRTESWELKAHVALLLWSKKWIGVEKHADIFEIPFDDINIPAAKTILADPYTRDWVSQQYMKIMEQYNIDYLFLSGWLKLVLWMNSNKCINIHPGPTQRPYGWEGMHGMAVHEKIWEDYQAWIIHQTCVTMHYATNQFDDPRFTIAQIPVTLEDCNSADDIQKKVNKMEHEVQWKITQMIVNKDINWSWDENDSIQVDMEAANEYNFPEGSVFAENLDLMAGSGYKDRS
jgi:folate-dependent phosphoribosylglycinamide formyltransferase PurN